MSSELSASSSAVSSALSSASSAASSAVSVTSSAASLSLSSASATASVFTNGTAEPSETSNGMVALYALSALITLLAGLAAAVYFGGYADDVATWWAKRYYKAKALAQVEIMKNTGSEKVEGLMKDSLKKNPVMGADELDQVSAGLGGEAVKEGFEGVSDKLGGLGKLG